MYVFIDLILEEILIRVLLTYISGDSFEDAKIILGGDQLVRVRMSGAKDLAGAHTAVERMEIFDPVIEELFHVEQDFLDVSSAA